MKKKPLLERDGSRAVLASLLSIIIGFLAGSLLILAVGLATPELGLSGAWEGIRIVIGGLFSTGRDAVGNLTFGFNGINIGNMLFRAIPLVMTGLSVALGLKAGLFNIGTPGQYLAGMTTTLFIGLSIPTPGSPLTNFLIESGVEVGFTMPSWAVWTLAFVGGMVVGAIWGAIPGMLKALLNINEVLACIMTNWIAANLATWLFDVSNIKNMIDGNKNAYIYKMSVNNVATSKMGLDQLFPGSQVNGGIFIGIVFAILVYILLNKTTTGYELKACGANRFAARYAGMGDKKTIIKTMAICGALSAAGGSLYALAGNTEFYWNCYQALPAEGFNGIPVALLAANNPIGVIFAAIFMSMLNVCGLQLRNLTSFNEYITDIIIAVIVYLAAFSLVIKLWLGKMSGKKKAATVEAKTNQPSTGKEQ